MFKNKNLYSDKHTQYKHNYFASTTSFGKSSQKQKRLCLIKVMYKVKLINKYNLSLIYIIKSIFFLDIGTRHAVDTHSHFDCVSLTLMLLSIWPALGSYNSVTIMTALCTANLALWLRATLS